MTQERPGPNEIAAEQPTTFDAALVQTIPALRALARSLCGYRDVADDLVQEALAKAWQHRDRFQFGTNLKAWLFVILRNEFYSMHRRAKIAADYTATLAHNSSQTDGEQEAKVDISDLMRAFARLAPEQKEALILTANDFSYEEVAKICDCAVGTVKSRVFRARQQLQKMVEGEGGKIEGRKSCTTDLGELLFNTPSKSLAEKRSA